MVQDALLVAVTYDLRCAGAEHLQRSGTEIPPYAAFSDPPMASEVPGFVLQRRHRRSFHSGRHARPSRLANADS